MKIAITGGIGSGKSYVCSCLKAMGIDVYDCDSAAKRIMRSSPEVRQRLQGVIGDDAYAGNMPNKARIASFILASEENARLVNGIVHPAVAADFQASGLQFMECAILFTSGFDRLVDRTICVTAPLEVRVSRVMRRDNISRENALEWIHCQMSQEEMAERCNYQIINDGKAPIETQLENIGIKNNEISIK